MVGLQMASPFRGNSGCSMSRSSESCVLVGHHGQHAQQRTAGLQEQRRCEEGERSAWSNQPRNEQRLQPSPPCGAGASRAEPSRRSGGRGDALAPERQVVGRGAPAASL